MLNLYFLLGEKRPFYLSGGEELLINIVQRLSLPVYDYEIGYCYDFTPATRKRQRYVPMEGRLKGLTDYFEKDPNKILVGMGWMAIELLTNIPKTKAAQVMGCRFPIPPFLYNVWFTYDPAAAIYDPKLYVDITGCISAAMRYAGRQIVIDTSIRPYKWNI